MPLLEKHITQDGTLWGIWQMTEDSPNALCPFVSKLQIAEAELRFKTSQRQMEWLAARALLAVLLDCGPCEVDYLETGKPFLKNDLRNISISHTKGYVAVSVSLNETGIDVERYHTRVCHVSSRFVRDDEVVPSYNGDSVWGLLLHWSAKEAIYKCLGMPGVGLKEHLQILPFEITVASGLFYAQELFSPLRRHFSITYLLREDYVLTLTSCR